MPVDPSALRLLPLLFALAACDAGPPSAASVAGGRPAPVAADATHGRIEAFGDLRIVRVWGTPAQRGDALGRLLGEEIVQLMCAEYDHRFGQHPQLAAQARLLLPRLIAYPEPIRAELDAMWAAIEASVPERTLPRLGRALDHTDLLVANALDVFGTMGCSGFTVWDADVEGGGVLAARNFDWPYTGRHMVDSAIVLVEHPDDGHATASVTWPGYVGTVTAINEQGLAIFLHVGNGRRTRLPEPGSFPTAAAARRILERAGLADASGVARELLELTSPPASYITRLVLPSGPNPAQVFEVDAGSVEERIADGPCVVTNHFLGRLATDPSRDSQARFDSMSAGLRRCCVEDDRKVSVAEAWRELAAVERAGSFGTLHSLVFRAEPWVFELAIGRDAGGGRVQAAPSHGRRYAIPRDALFRDPRVPLRR